MTIQIDDRHMKIYEEYEKWNIQYLGILPETIDIVSHFREIYCQIACVLSDKYFRFIFNVCCI